MLVRGAEMRFGNGDQIYTEEELDAALTSWYTIFNGQQTFLGDPLHIRLGIELAF